jgi:hypothetical protein
METQRVVTAGKLNEICAGANARENPSDFLHKRWGFQLSSLPCFQQDCNWCMMYTEFTKVSCTFPVLYNFIYVHKKSMTFPMPRFVNLTNTEQDYLQMSYTEHYPNQSMWKVWIEVHLHP